MAKVVTNLNSYILLLRGGPVFKSRFKAGASHRKSLNFLLCNIQDPWVNLLASFPGSLFPLRGQESLGTRLPIWCIIIHLTHANVCESMGKPCSCTQFIKSCIYYYKSHENPISTTSHARIRIRYYIVPSYTGKKYHSFVAVGIVTCATHS